MVKSHSLKNKRSTITNMYEILVRKTIYFYRHKDGSFKPIYVHKYIKILELLVEII